MTAYRFCRTDDIGLLVDALNHCWSPYAVDEPPMTPAAFKRSIRDLQVWCSSCMVAFSGSEPIGVLIGAKRPSGTLVHKIAVHPDHRRQGHGHHMLASLGSKLAILGPPRIVAEVPGILTPACELFSASGYVQEALLTDYVLDCDDSDPPELAGRFVIPVTVDDLSANGLLEAHPHACWERSVETLTARKDEIEGFGVASDERIESYLLYLGGARTSGGPDVRTSGSLTPGVPDFGLPDFEEADARACRTDAEILLLRSFVEDGEVHLRHLLARLGGRGLRTVRFPKVHAAEMSTQFLETLGFRAAGEHLLFEATPRHGSGS